MNFVKCYVGSSLFAHGKEVEIAESIVHPHYRFPVLQYDIAIIRLKDNLTFVNKKIQPIALPDKSDIIPNGQLCMYFEISLLIYINVIYMRRKF